MSTPQGKTLYHILIACTLLSGCASFSHVSLSAPTQDAPLQERLDAYERLAPAPFVPPLRTSMGSLPGGLLELSDGTIVYWAEDVLPVVPEHSRTATSARKASRAMKTAKALAIVGGATSIVGALLIIARNLGRMPMPEQSKTGSALLATGVLLGFGGTIVTTIGAIKLSGAQRENTWAFGTYDTDVRQQLGICRLNSGEIIDCAQRATSPSTAHAQ